MQTAGNEYNERMQRNNIVYSGLQLIKLHFTLALVKKKIYLIVPEAYTAIQGLTYTAPTNMVGVISAARGGHVSMAVSSGLISNVMRQKMSLPSIASVIKRLTIDLSYASEQ